MNVAVIIYGPPGSGKGTQANLLAHKLDFIHLDTGKHLESVVHDPENIGDPKLDKAREDFDEGRLLDPAWVLEIVSKKVEQIGRTGHGIVFSGSPRTLFEAEGLIPILEKFYGKEHIIPFVLAVPDETSIKRNSARTICETCGVTILNTLIPEDCVLPFCPVCGSAFRTRTLDKPDIIRVRLKEYTERTKPIFDYLTKRGYTLTEIDGTPRPTDVLGALRAGIEKHTRA